MNPSSRFLPLSSLPRSTSQIDPALTQQPPPQDVAPPSLPSHAAPSPSTAAANEERVEQTDQEQEEEEQQDPSTTSPPPLPPNFTPYFTLLSTSNRATNHTNNTETHHPTVRYIFADDPADASPIADAALELLDPSDDEEDDDDDDGDEGDDDEDAVRDNGRRKKGNRKIRRRREERYVLLEMDASGTKVRSAKSLSPEWAVTGAEVGVAPTWDGDGSGGGGSGAAAGVGSEVGAGGGGWMLRVEGVEVFVEGDDRGGREEEDVERGLEELAEEYERRMGELRRVIGAGSGGSG